MDKYLCEHELGSGGYGSVWRCRSLRTSETVAIKWFKEAHVHQEAMRHALREIKMMKAANHRNVVKFHEAFRRTNGRLYMVMDYVEGTMASLLKGNRSGLKLPQAKLYMWQLCQAVHYLHRSKVFHRDLKPMNILVSSTGVIKLCDFGLARMVDPQAASNYSPYVVTRWYRPPEVLVKDEYGPAIDVWALGCILFELLTGRALLPGNSTLHQLALTHQVLGSLSPRQLQLLQRENSGMQLPATDKNSRLQECFFSFSKETLQFLSGCLQADPDQRLTVEQLLALPFFDDVYDHLPELAEINAEAYGPGRDVLIPSVAARVTLRSWGLAGQRQSEGPTSETSGAPPPASAPAPAPSAAALPTPCECTDRQSTMPDAAPQHQEPGCRTLEHVAQMSSKVVPASPSHTCSGVQTPEPCDIRGVYVKAEPQQQQQQDQQEQQQEQQRQQQEPELSTPSTSPCRRLRLRSSGEEITPLGQDHEVMLRSDSAGPMYWIVPLAEDGTPMVSTKQASWQSARSSKPEKGEAFPAVCPCQRAASLDTTLEPNLHVAAATRTALDGQSAGTDHRQLRRSYRHSNLSGNLNNQVAPPDADTKLDCDGIVKACGTPSTATAVSVICGDGAAPKVTRTSRSTAQDSVRRHVDDRSPVDTERSFILSRLFKSRLSCREHS